MLSGRVSQELFWPVAAAESQFLVVFAAFLPATIVTHPVRDLKQTNIPIITREQQKQTAPILSFT